MDFGQKRLGNWVVTKYNKEGVPFIRIKPVSGEFAWEYSSLDPKFAIIDSAMSNEMESEALAECFAIDNELLHNETGIFHLIYKLSMDLFYHIAAQRKLRGDDNVVDVIIKSFNNTKKEVDSLYGGSIDPTGITEEDVEALNEMKVEYELGEELNKSVDGEEGKTEGEV